MGAIKAPNAFVGRPQGSRVPYPFRHEHGTAGALPRPDPYSLPGAYAGEGVNQVGRDKLGMSVAKRLRDLNRFGGG